MILMVNFSKHRFFNSLLVTMEADPTKAYNLDDATGFHPAQCAPSESRGKGAWEEIDTQFLRTRVNNEHCIRGCPRETLMSATSGKAGGLR